MQSYPQTSSNTQEQPTSKKPVLTKSKLTFDQFLDIYVKPFKSSDKYEISLPMSFKEICGGWQSVTFKQIIVTMTKSGNNPLPLIFNSPEHMRNLSNKQEPIKNIFNHMDYKMLNRIDALELISGILLAVEGKFDQYISNVLFIFGFSNNTQITKLEFEFFLDCFFRSVMTLVTPPELIQNRKLQKQFQSQSVSPYIGKQLSSQQIQLLSSSLFPPSVEHYDCKSLSKALQESKNPLTQQLYVCMATLNEKIQGFVQAYYQNILMCNKIKQILGQAMVKMRKVVNQNIEQIEKQKKEGKYQKGQYQVVIPEEGFF